MPTNAAYVGTKFVVSYISENVREEVTDDIAHTEMFMYSQPQNINIREVVIAATRQPT